MPLSSGTRLGTYQITGPLGTGGMGEVYRAKDLRLGREVAVKVLPQGVASSPDRLARFEREARTVAGLNHPNVVTLFSVEEEDGIRFLTMELVEGQTLSTLVTTGGLPLSRLLDLSIPLTDALVAAHERGVIHRDLKPGNVMVTREGRVKVLDFGLAKMAGEEAPPTEQTLAATVDSPISGEGQVLGTVPYMPPEQLRGERVDARSDLFALGIILYELSTGRRPFTGDSSVEISSSILRDTPEPLTHVRADLPPDLERIVSRCLEKNPRERIQSALDVSNELRRLRTLIERGESEMPASDRVASIAVLPFVNRSRDEEDEYFSDGLADELLNVLSKIKGLRVSARTSSFQFKGKTDDIATIGRKLNVATVLEGSVRMAGNRVRISVQLVKVSDGYHLWSERYDRQIEDIFQVQDEIAIAIAGALKVKLLGEEQAAMAKRPTLNVEAYQFYLKGRHHWQKWTAEELQKARGCFERAIALDPKCALAYFGLADVFAVESMVSTPPREAWPKAKAALTKALALDEALAEAWTLTGVFYMSYEWNQSAARTALMRALEVDPLLGHAYAVLAQVEMFSGRSDDAVAAARRAVELEPLVAIWNYVLAWVHWAQGDYALASHQLEVLLEIDPTSWLPHFGSGIVAGALGKQEEAIRSLEEAVRYSGGSPYAIGYLACAYALAGRRFEAQQQLAALHDRAKHSWVPALSVAIANLGLGPVDRVFEWLERAYEERDLWLLWHMHDPGFQTIRSDPRMIDLLRRLGAPE
jgi:serine/threonine protein kinase/tetratricopeptide (TPR) repeat protein